MHFIFIILSFSNQMKNNFADFEKSSYATKTNAFFIPFISRTLHNDLANMAGKQLNITK